MKRLSVLLSLLCCVWLHVSTVVGIDVVFSYDDQGAWPGVCVTGNTVRQSPINIVTDAVVVNPALSSLVFSSSWAEPTADGVFANTGHTVQFALDSDSPTVTTETPVGTYQFVQLHFHWGRNNNEGSENLINGEPAQLEIHFVHTRVGPGDAGNELAVIGVLAEASNAAPTGPWAALALSNLGEPGGNITVDDFTLSSLLPVDRDYYYFPGSLTTPLCTESVQWYVLKDRIPVPAMYLEMLRNIREVDGSVLSYNFRMPQDIGSRVVMTTASSVGVTSLSLMTILSLALLIIAGLD